MGYVGWGHIRVWGNRPDYMQTLTAGQMKLEIQVTGLELELEKKCSCVLTMEYLCEYQIICAYLKSEQDIFNIKSKPSELTKKG